MQMHRDQDDHHAEDGHARVREHGKPHVGKACKAQQHDADLDGKLSAADAQDILVYYTENTLSGMETDWSAGSAGSRFPTA